MSQRLFWIRLNIQETWQQKDVIWLQPIPVCKLNACWVSRLLCNISEGHCGLVASPNTCDINALTVRSKSIQPLPEDKPQPVVSLLFPWYIHDFLCLQSDNNLGRVVHPSATIECYNSSFSHSCQIPSGLQNTSISLKNIRFLLQKPPV